MNTTYEDAEYWNEPTKEVCVDYIISLATVGSLFVVSEVLPFLKGHKGNGLVDLLICCFEGSDCILSKMIDCLKKKEEAPQAQEQEQEQTLTNTNNISINIPSH